MHLYCGTPNFRLGSLCLSMKNPNLELLKYGRKTLSFAHGEASLTRISVTERVLPREDESTFTQRLLKKYGEQQGTIEIVIKNGRPDYAIITIV